MHADARFTLTAVYAFLPDLEVISKELYAFEGKTGDDATAEPESMDVDDFDEDEELLRELFEDSETEQASNRIRSTRTRQTRRPEHFGYSSVGPSSPAIVKQEVEVEVKAKEGEGEGEKKELGNVDEVDPNAQAMQAQAKVDAALAQKQFKQERKVMRDKMLQVSVCNRMLYLAALILRSVGRQDDLGGGQEDAPNR